MNLRKLITFLIMVVIITPYSPSRAQQYRIPKVDLDSTLMAFISESIVPIRKYDELDIGVVYFRDKILELSGSNDRFMDDVQAKIRFSNETPNYQFYGYEVINNVIFLFIESQDAKNFINKTDGPTLPVLRKKNDTSSEDIPILVDWGQTFWIKQDSTGYKLKYR